MEVLVDYKGRHASHSTTGGWTAALFVIGVEGAERFAFSGIQSNLITFLTGPLGQSTAAAAANVNVWTGMSWMLPLLGGFLADGHVGRYRMIVVSSLLYILALGVLALFAGLQTVSANGSSLTGNTITTSSMLPPHSNIAIFFFFLYLVAVAESGHKPSIQAFGADQFDGQDPSESRSKSSFFNWLTFSLCLGILASQLFLTYIQDNVSWALGFGLPGIAMVVALMMFLLGTRTYRYHVVNDGNKETLLQHQDESIRLDDEVAVVVANDHVSCSVKIQSEPKSRSNSMGVPIDFLPLIPIWSTSLLYAIVYSQLHTFFTKQGSTLDRCTSHDGKCQVPPAALLSFSTGTVIICLAFYDRVIVPIARKLTGNPSGLSMLRRIGTGMFMAPVCMVVAAVMERKRLQTAKDHGIVDTPEVPVPMSLWWLVPQYAILGVGNALTMAGLQEFFYDQMPGRMRSFGLALYMSIFGMGDLLSGFMISIIDRVTSWNGDSWFSDNLNRAHLDYFYLLLVVLTSMGMIVYLYFARSYVYKISY